MHLIWIFLIKLMALSVINGGLLVLSDEPEEATNVLGYCEANNMLPVPGQSMNDFFQIYSVLMINNVPSCWHEGRNSINILTRSHMKLNKTVWEDTDDPLMTMRRKVICYIPSLEPHRSV
jgi:hypothetical protein